MADVTGSGYMGDATGGIGQGLAFVLPESKSATYAMQLAQTHASQLQTLARSKMALQAKAQAQYESDFKEQSLPKAFAPFDKAINDRQNKWLQDGAKEYATTGKNPFSDPAFISRHNDEILTPAAKSLELGQNYTKIRAIAETDPTNKYTKESKQAVIDYEQKIKDDPFGAIDKPLPQLVETPATADDLIKTLKPSGDPSYNNAQVFAAATGDPKWQPVLKKYGYNPDLPDFGVYTDPSHPNGKRVWYTNPTFTGHQADLILEAPTDPKNAKILGDLGIHPEDQYAKEKLQHAISDQNAAMGKFVSENGARLDDPEKKQQLADQQFNTNLRVKEYNLRVQEHKDLQTERKAKFQATPPFDRAAQQMKDAHTSGDDASVKKLADDIVEHVPSKKYKESITTDVKNGVLTIHVPKEHLPSGNGARAYDIPVDLTDPNFESVLWAKMKGVGMDVDSYNKAHKTDGGGSAPAKGKPKPNNSSLTGWNQ